MSDIASAAVFFPEKAAVYQSSFQQVKPTSCLVLTLMDGSERIFRVPMRVGRILQLHLDALPQSVSEAVDYIDSLQRRAAFSYLVEFCFPDVTTLQGDPGQAQRPRLFTALFY